MTEEDAKTKWCPFARVSEITPEDVFTPASNRIISEFEDGSSNFYAERKAGAQCIGSVCMAWRWATEAPAPRLGLAEAAVIILGTDEQRDDVRAEMAAKRPGYCGLAGAQP